MEEKVGLMIDKILETMGDGKWHEVVSLVDVVDVSEVKLGIILAFLVNYGFVELDEKGISVKLPQHMQTFLSEIKKLEIKERLRA